MPDKLTSASPNGKYFLDPAREVALRVDWSEAPEELVEDVLDAIASASQKLESASIGIIIERWLPKHTRTQPKNVYTIATKGGLEEIMAEIFYLPSEERVLSLIREQNDWRKLTCIYGAAVLYARGWLGKTLLAEAGSILAIGLTEKARWVTLLEDLSG